MTADEARAAVARKASVGEDGKDIAKLAALIAVDAEVLRALAIFVFEEDDHEDGLFEGIRVLALGERIEHPGCGSMNFPGDETCWGCEEKI